MSFKSEAQRRKFQLMVKEGKLSQETYDEWESATDRKRLPDRVPEKTKRRTKVRKVRVK